MNCIFFAILIRTCKIPIMHYNSSYFNFTLMNQSYEDAKNLISKSGNILIISHRKPDADTLGSAICLKLWIGALQKDTTLACIDRPSPVFSFLPAITEFVHEFSLKKYDLVIIVDAGASYMTNFHLKYENLFSAGVPIINIDHHASNDMFGQINIVDAKAASTTIIIYRFLKYLEVALDNEMATSLLAGIYGDTGGFMHSNTSKEVFDVSAELMKFGANIKDITASLFRNKPVSMLKLWGRVLENAHVTHENVVVSVIKEEDYTDVSSGPEQLSGIVDYLNMVPDSKFAVLLNEDRRGNVKGSFRTRNNDIDLSRIAAVFGGGGHPKASGFMMPGRIEEEFKYNVVSDDQIIKTLDFS